MSTNYNPPMNRKAESEWFKRYFRRNLKKHQGPHKRIRLWRAQRFMKYWRAL